MIVYDRTRLIGRLSFFFYHEMYKVGGWQMLAQPLHLIDSFFYSFRSSFFVLLLCCLIDREWSLDQWNVNAANNASEYQCYANGF